MKFKNKYTNSEISELKEKQFSNFKLDYTPVIQGVSISKTKESFFQQTINIYLGSDYYGEIKIDNGYRGKDDHYPIIKAGRISHMYGLNVRDHVYLTDVFPELRNKDFTLTVDMLKHLVVAQLRKSYPMAIWPDPLINN